MVNAFSQRACGYHYLKKKPAAFRQRVFARTLNDSGEITPAGSSVRCRSGFFRHFADASTGQQPAFQHTLRMLSINICLAVELNDFRRIRTQKPSLRSAFTRSSSAFSTVGADHFAQQQTGTQQRDVGACSSNSSRGSSRACFSLPPKR